MFNDLSFVICLNWLIEWLDRKHDIWRCGDDETDPNETKNWIFRITQAFDCESSLTKSQGDVDQ